jgi:hypothetical protein
MRKYLLLALLAFANAANAQDTEGSLLDMLGTEEEKPQRVTNAFKSSRVINSQSMELIHAGTMDFRILHRFGEVSTGYQDLYGLDNATMRMGFDYGITDDLSIGIGRSTNKKELDGFVKYRILAQTQGKKSMPISLIWVSGLTRNGLAKPFSQPDVKVTESRRLAYYHQIVIGRKFSEKFTLQLTPTLVHTNLVENEVTPNNLVALGIGGRYKFSQRVAFVWDYSFAFNRFPGFVDYNPLSLGFDIETGGHVFQVHFSNALGLNERAFLNDKNGNWFKGNIRLGFNLSRIFQIKKNKV